jgi:hypothetical protein
MFNPRYTGMLAFKIPPSMEEKHKHKVVGIFYERICCAGKNGCTIISKDQKKNLKMCK